MTTILYLSLLLVLATQSHAVNIPIDGVMMNEEGDLLWNGQLYTAEQPQNLSEEELLDPHTSDFWVQCGICIGLVLLGGLMSGLTVGLFSISPLELAIIAKECNESDEEDLLENDRDEKQANRERALRLEPILSQHHLLLCTLLMANAAAMEALPIFLDELVPSYIAIIISVTAVLIFGEILPQAVFTKDPIKKGARMVPVVKFFMYALYPLTYPISKLLDCVLGHEGHHHLFPRSQLATLIQLHDENLGGGLSSDEMLVMKGALDMRHKVARECCKLIDATYMVDADAELDEKMATELLCRGHSRIPVYRNTRHNIVGLLLVKRLIAYDYNDKREIGSLGLRRPLVCSADLPMFELLDEFQKGRSHLAILTDSPFAVRESLKTGRPVPPDAKVIGIITLEDVVSELIGEEIDDEVDFRRHHLFFSGVVKVKRALARARARIAAKAEFKSTQRAKLKHATTEPLLNKSSSHNHNNQHPTRLSHARRTVSSDSAAANHNHHHYGAIQSSSHSSPADGKRSTQRLPLISVDELRDDDSPI